jgi:hypothetical protein
MQKFYDDLDPKMADVTIDDLIATLPTDANWSEYFLFLPLRLFDAATLLFRSFCVYSEKVTV